MAGEPGSAQAWLFAASGKTRPGIAALTLLRSAISASAVAFALLLKCVIDAAVAGDGEGFVRFLLWLVLLIASQLAVNVLIRRLNERMRTGIENELKRKAYETVLGRSYSTLASMHSGEIMNHMTNDTVVIADGIVSIIPNTVAMAVKICGAAYVLILLDSRFAAVFICGGVILLFVTYGFRKVMKRLHKEVQEADGRVRSFLQETIENLLVLRSYRCEDRAAAAAAARMGAHREARLRRNRFSNICSTGLACVMDSGYVFGLVWCGFGILDGTISYGTLMAVLQLVGQIQAPFANVTGYLPRYFAVLASAERLMALEDLESRETAARLSAAERDALYGAMESIRLEDVTFSYPGAESPVMEGVSLTIPKGGFIAVSGRSGIGKSTLLKLLLAVYRPEGGKLEFHCGEGGRSVPVSPATRPMFAYVPQGSFLLSGKLWEAVSFLQEGEPDYGRIRKACRIACADFIESLPDGYETVLGEKGAGLSEGQVQRLAIARAIYSEAPVLLLDESTSALDEATEEAVLRNIRELTDKTVIVVTHRPAALKFCSAVVRMQGQELVVEGAG